MMASDDGVMFSTDSARRIARVTRDAEMTARGDVGRGQGANIKPLEMVGITTTAITARSGKTPGSGKVQPYYDNGTVLVEDANQEPVTVKNWTGSAVASDIWVKYTVISGFLYLDGTDCSGVAP
jgi:hypothetical protein